MAEKLRHFGLNIYILHLIYNFIHKNPTVQITNYWIACMDNFKLSMYFI